MELIQWNEKYRIGVPEIDQDHEMLIGLINELYAKVEAHMEREEIKDFFRRVEQEMAAHFAREEKMMVEHHYDGYAEHKADHEKLLGEIRDIAEDFADGVCDYDPDKALARQLTDWFVAHTQNHDAALRLLPH